MNGGSARLRILYEHASSVGPRSNSFSSIRRRALGLLYRKAARARGCPVSPVSGAKRNDRSAQSVTPKHPSSSAIGYLHQIKFVRGSTSLPPPIVFGFSETRQGC